MTIILLFILYLLITNQKVVSTEIYNSTIMWFSTLIPIMFPSFVVIDFLQNMPLIDKISKFIYKPFKYIFNIKYKKSSFLILFCFICGSPASTKLIYNAYMNNEISKKEYQSLVCTFSFLSLPYTILLCNKFYINIYLYYLTIIILTIILMHIINNQNDIYEPTIIENKINIKYIDLLFESIKKNTQIIINILGILIIFRVLIKLFLNNIILYPFFEILGGMEVTNNQMIALAAMGFLGISEHLQIISIAKDLNYKKLFFCRLFFSVIFIISFFNK